MKRLALIFALVGIVSGSSVSHANGLTKLAGTSWNTLFRTTIHFGRNGKVSGFAGCNRYGGNYSQNGKRVHIGRVFSTKKACPARRMGREYLMFRKLRDVYKFKGTRKTLFLLDRRGNTVFTLLPKRK